MKQLAWAAMMAAAILCPGTAKAQYYDIWQMMQPNIHFMNAYTSAFEAGSRPFMRQGQSEISCNTFYDYYLQLYRSYCRY
ncbi:hypothetical protein [Synechococcus sp. UW140]|uniref:hypothetical protein n=1 Tax=Synechococcus sp. UW140 TaxID=368503 RepID=UPI0031379C09